MVQAVQSHRRHGFRIRMSRVQRPLAHVVELVGISQPRLHGGLVEAETIVLHVTVLATVLFGNGDFGRIGGL